MPIVIPKGLVSGEMLQKERIFAYSDERAVKQDIRPLEMAVINLMPKKEEAEIQLFRMLSNSPLQVNIDLIRMQTYEAKNSDPARLRRFYKSFDEIKTKKYDGIIVTGAPLEKMEYSKIIYWEELKKVFDFAESNVYSSLFICWGAQAALHHYFNVEANLLEKKIFGVYAFARADDVLCKGFDDEFFAPQSRYSRVDKKELEEAGLKVLSFGEETGAVLSCTVDHRKIFSLSHFEYDRMTLHEEYMRDREKGLDTQPPENYYGEAGSVKMKWHAAGQLFFSNWLNFCVYQSTPYDLGEL